MLFIVFIMYVNLLEGKYITIPLNEQHIIMGLEVVTETREKTEQFMCLSNK